VEIARQSAVVGLGATIIALVLGTMAAFAVQRYAFFGRNVVSFLVVLPITLPGIVTGIALNATFTSALGVTLGMATVIVGPRNVLHRHRVQQHPGPVAPTGHQPR